jgi:hypothetical protein
MRAFGAAWIAATLIACSPAASTTTPTPPASPSQTSTLATGSPTRPAQTAAPVSATPFATPTPITDLTQVFRPASTGWRLSGPTIIAATTDDRGNSTLVGIPLGASGPSSPPISILSFTSSGWDIRPDGGAIAVVVATDHGTRIATWNFGASLAAWVTAPDQSPAIALPVWSKDGAWIYFGAPGTSVSTNFTGTISRIRPDGSGRSDIATLERFGGLSALTPDGRGLIWSRIQAGGSAEIFDIATGVNRHLEDVAGVDSIRTQQPRVLLTVGGCCAGFPGGSLVLWDDTTMTSRPIAERTNVPRVAWGAAAWDPTGMRIAAARFEEASPYRAGLALLDPVAGTVQPIAGPSGVGQLVWLDEGIVYLSYPGSGNEVELMLVSPRGGTPISLYKGTNMYRMVVIRP